MLLAVLATTIASSVFAGSYSSVDQVKMVYLEDSTRYVCNPDSILSPDSVAQMDAMIRFLEDSTSIQIVVVAVEKIESGDCFQFATDLGNHYGVGQKGSNNGLVILLSTQDRCIQFATGSGLEGYLPDAICNRIQRRYMNDALAEGKWDEGLTAGVRAVCGYLDGSMKPDIDSEDEDDGVFGGLLVFFGLTGAFAWYRNRQSKKCPNCKQIALEHKDTQTLKETKTYKRVEAEYVCKKCGHSVKRQSTISTVATSRSRGGYYGGGSRGGGFSGGSFGGGHFGGGGSGSRF